MTAVSLKNAIILSVFAMAACGGSGSGGGGAGTGAIGVDEVESLDYSDLGDRGAVGTAAVTYVVLDGEIATSDADATLDYTTGQIAGGALDGTSLVTSDYENPADGEYSRIIALDGAETLFGAGGLITRVSDLPDAGTTNYNLGWVGLTATTDTDVYTLTGDATFVSNWTNGSIRGDFDKLSGTDALDQSVSDVGTITLLVSGASISGSSFSGGTVSGTGTFASLDAGSDTSKSAGRFFGPAADEIGGILVIEDADVSILGAYQAD
ncbi:transferrin-binding protein-like solute binding protein [Yoonia litorea]|uniref:Transferrin-binding protein B C-lobe/N-lobe beta-barrel domain-containing protein n=1 Tax=Yoonia litorea TaxID=1123755 RepID=A0A1I6L143_9RHOB|nr:transferrin-binding protein-like solute binding protein [Yoonia litorea]SFR97213.1 hypothetical protein SAMN05444714_0073 [Yoonia litorea]